jgi:hypothetical protein
VAKEGKSRLSICRKSKWGEKTAIELFIAGVRDWEAGLRRQLEPHLVARLNITAIPTGPWKMRIIKGDSRP